MADSDGSIIVNVGMNIDDAEKELDRLGKRVIKLQNDLNETSGKKSSLEKEFQRANEELKQLYATAARDKNGLLLPDEAAKLEQLEQHAAWLGEQLDKTSKQEIIDRAALDGANNAFGELSKQVVELQSVEQQPDPEAQHLAEIYQNAEIADNEIAGLARQLDRLKERQAELQKAGVGIGFEEFDANEQRIAEINERLSEYRKNLLGAGNAAEEAGKSAQNAANGMGLAATFTGRFANRIMGLVKRVFVFSLVTAGLRALRTWLANVIQTNTQAQASLSQLKAAFLTLAQPILNVLIPALVFLLNVLTKIVTMIANVVSKLFGTTLGASAKAAKNMYAQTTTGAGSAAKSLKKEKNALEDVDEAAEDATGSLAGFDEINTLATEKPDDGLDDIADDLGGGGGIGGGEMPDFASLIDAQINAILELFTGLALLALGAILTFTGANIPLGIGLMILGAMLIADAVMTNQEAIVEALRGPLGALLALIGGALFVVGAILAFSGANIPLGIALMAIGAAAFATAVALNWDSISQALQGPLGALLGIISGALLVLGAILAFSGVNIPLGIALIAIGAIGLAMAVAANWNTIVDAMNGPIGTITKVISAALLVIGGVLLFTAANIPLGLGLMAAGAAGLAVSLSPYWDKIQTILQGKIGAITAIISAALLVLGIILVFTGVGIPLGLGMILAGAVGLAATVAANWDFILEKLKGAWRDIKNWWNSNVSNFTNPSWWADLGRRMMDGLLDGLRSIFSGLSSWASSVWSSITSSFSGSNARAAISNGMPSPIMRSALPNIPIMDVPALARGAVIPANREFLAVLGDQSSGTNVEAPLNTIKQALLEAMAEGGMGNADIHITVELDGREVAKNTVHHINRMTRAAGKPVILY